MAQNKRANLRERRDPETPVEFLAERVREHVFMPDPYPLYALLGALAANMVEGCPVWLMLVGPSGAGKTMFLESTNLIDHIVCADSIDSEAAFLSGTAKKEKAKHATGGLLPEVGTHGAIMIKDFTGILSLPRDKIKKILDVFRQAYDGSWSRPIGGEGGHRLVWEGRLALLSGVTGEIDDAHQVSSVLGERWLFFRMISINSFAQLRKGLTNQSVKGWRKELQMLVKCFFEGLDLKFGQLEERRALTEKETLRVATIAEVAAHCRSGVKRDNFNKEIVASPDTELETRIGTQLGQLYIGMEVIGVREVDRWRILQKIALDSMPQLRRRVLECVTSNGGGGVLMTDIMKMMTVKEAEAASRAAIDRAVVDLAIHGVVQKDKVGGEGAEAGKVRVSMTPWMKKEYLGGFGG